MDKLEKIERATAEKVVNAHVNDYYRVFDFSKYAENVQRIADTKKTIDNDTLVYLLRYLFVLEYRYEQQLWYDVHPCLSKAVEKHSE